MRVQNKMKKIFPLVYWRTLLTKIFTTLVMVKMRTVSNIVIRFWWLGRVVEKKL